MTTPDDVPGEPVRRPVVRAEVPESSLDDGTAHAPVERAAVSPGPSSRPTRRFFSLRPRHLWRVAGEVAIVTLGVLIAFVLNAWWMERADLRQEQVHLRALVSDFEWNLGSLRAHVERQERVSRASRELLEIARSEPGAPAERVLKLIGPVFASGRFEPATGAYEALLNSAGLTLVRNSDLRASLTTFATQFEDRYAERFADELYLSFIRDFAGQLGFTDLALGESSSRSFAPLLGNPRFQEHLVFRDAAESAVTGQYRRLMSSAQTVLDHLRDELR